MTDNNPAPTDQLLQMNYLMLARIYDLLAVHFKFSDRPIPGRGEVLPQYFQVIDDILNRHENGDMPFIARTDVAE